MTELWAPVPGYDGLYEVSDAGRVRSVAFRNGSVAYRLRPQALVLRPNPVPPIGYLRISLCKNGAVRGAFVHQLVLIAFVGQRPAGHVAGHRDGNHTNNRLENLAWITRTENEEDKKRHGRKPVGEQSLYAKMTEAQAVDALRRYADGESQVDIGRRFGVTRYAIYNLVHGRSWRHLPRAV